MLTDSQIEQFWTDGYIQLSNFFDPSDVASILDEYYKIFLPQLRLTGILPDDIEYCPTWSELITAVYCMHANYSHLYNNCRKQIKKSLAAYRLALDNRILVIIKQLGIQSPTLHQRPQLISDPGSTHSCDQLWKLWRPSCNAVAGFMYLGDNQHSISSLLHVVPGSHAGGMRTMSNIDSLHAESYQPIYGSCHKESLPLPGMDKYGTDLVLFSPLIVSSLPYTIYKEAALTWCYSDLVDSFYLIHGYYPSVSAPSGDALIEFLSTRKHSMK